MANVSSEPTYPRWEVSAIPGSDQELSIRSREVLQELSVLSPDEIVDALADPRGIHKKLYANLTPEGFPEYAGNYRGSAFPSLANRGVGVDPEIERLVGASQAFAAPGQVEEVMNGFRRIIEAYANKPIFNKDLAARAFGRVFKGFGRFHPFLDGNGHVQRIIFQVLVERSGNKVREPFVHPRPYDLEMGIALAKGDDDEIAKLLLAYIV